MLLTRDSQLGDMNSFIPHAISWNLTRRCNQRCTHCYMSALPGASAEGELRTEECFRVMDEIAEVNQNVLLILTGGEPLLRTDIFDLGRYGAEKGFTVVLGTNGFLLRQKQAKTMRQHRIDGASISLDSTDPSRHDAFRQLPGAWRGAVQATEVLQAEGFPFSLHMSVTDWNVDEIPAMIDLAHGLGAKILNLFFLVRTGRGEELTDISPEQYERILTYLARAQAIEFPQYDSEQTPRLDSGRAHAATDDPWETALGRAGNMLIRAKCAPFFRRILYGLDPSSPLLRNYAEGSCPAGRHYCRIMPNGEVTACPYMPVVAGNVRQTPFATLWRDAALFNDLRSARLGGRCGACEFSKVCGGCRCRAYATYGDYLAEDPACAYEPGAWGAHVIELPAEQTFGIAAEPTLAWTADAQGRLERVPGFARGMVVKAVERQARARACGVVTAELMREVRQRMLDHFPWFTRG